MKIQTLVKHKPGSKIHMGKHGGQEYDVQDAADGRQFVDVPDDDTAAIQRLMAIPEGFAPWKDLKKGQPAPAPKGAPAASTALQLPDFDNMKKDALLTWAAENLPNLEIKPATPEPTLRGMILRAATVAAKG